MAAFDGDGDGFPLFVYGVLEGGDGRGWFDDCPKDQGAAVTDSAKNSSGEVAGFVAFSLVMNQVMFLPFVLVPALPAVIV